MKKEIYTTNSTIKLNKCKHCLSNVNQGISWCEKQIPLFPNCCLCKEYEQDITNIQTTSASSMVLRINHSQKTNVGRRIKYGKY